MKHKLLSLSLTLLIAFTASAKKAVVASTIQLPPAEAIYNEGIKQLNQKDFETAIIKFTATISEDSLYSKAYYNRAVAYYEMKDYRKATADLNQTIIIKPSPESYLLRGKIFYKSSNIEACQEDIKKAIALDSTNIDAYLDQAAIFQQQMDYTAAIGSYTKVLSIDHKNALSLLERGNCYQYLNQEEEALKDYMLLIKNDSTNFRGLFNYTILTWKISKDSTVVLASLEKLKTKDPQNASLYNASGLVYSALENLGKALENYNKAIELQAYYPEAYNNRGVVYFKQKAYKKALSDYDSAILLNTNYGNAYLNRAIVKELLRDETGSCDDLRKAEEFGVKNTKQYIQLQCN